jgi:hypothetical protein
METTHASEFVVDDTLVVFADNIDPAESIMYNVEGKERKTE